MENIFVVCLYEYFGNLDPFREIIHFNSGLSGVDVHRFTDCRYLLVFFDVSFGRDWNKKPIDNHLGHRRDCGGLE